MMVCDVEQKSDPTAINDPKDDPPTMRFIYQGSQQQNVCENKIDQDERRIQGASV
ncbi:hypothetical protein LRA02_04570 [Lentilactobacillus rapi]|uniref:Uncharacterized protein n=1 Tax=Lentilactobacillus rapi TaxID=481723 RepID=A0A512PK63_9LACO|nr:hypothetical protein LRA02_04570 [Lentilactobacillus rapi]